MDRKGHREKGVQSQKKAAKDKKQGERKPEKARSRTRNRKRRTFKARRKRERDMQKKGVEHDNSCTWPPLVLPEPH